MTTKTQGGGPSPPGTNAGPAGPGAFRRSASGRFEPTPCRPERTSGGPYRVVVWDNYHPMDEDETYRSGPFATLDEAVSYCRKIVDEFLLSGCKPGKTSEELLSGYRGYGEAPYIDGPGGSAAFMPYEYAKRRCVELCGTPLDRSA